MEIWVPRVLKGGKREGSKARGEAQGHEEEEKKNKIKNKINIFANGSPKILVFSFNLSYLFTITHTSLNFLKS